MPQDEVPSHTIAYQPSPDDIRKALLILNKKCLEPLLRDLETSHLVFNSVNTTTKKSLKEFFFLKKKEEIEMAEIERIRSEEEVKPTRRIHLTNQPKSSSVQQAKAIKETTPISNNTATTVNQTTIPPQSKTSPIPKKPGTVPQTNIVKRPPKKPTTDPIDNPPKKNLESILDLARKIRSMEEKKLGHTTVPDQSQLETALQPMEEEENKDSGQEKTNEPEQLPQPEIPLKLSFVTMDERFKHYVDLLHRVHELNEKSESVGKLFEKKTKWNFSSPQLLCSGKSSSKLQENCLEKYNTFIHNVVASKYAIETTWNEDDVNDFHSRLIFNEEDMHCLELELLKGTKEVKQPEITSVNHIYSDIPNTYISRWLPKRVDPQVTNALVPHRDLRKKRDKKRDNYSIYTFPFRSKSEMRTIHELRFKNQHLLLKRYVFDKVFNEFKLLHLLPALKEHGKDDEYFKLLRSLEGIIPCEELRDENGRNIINWQSMFHFVSQQRETDSTEQEDDLEDDSDL